MCRSLFVFCEKFGKQAQDSKVVHFDKKNASRTIPLSVPQPSNRSAQRAGDFSRMTVCRYAERNARRANLVNRAEYVRGWRARFYARDARSCSSLMKDFEESERI